MEIQFNFSDFEELARRLDGAESQIPFALSIAMNKAAMNTRQVLINQTWPSAVQVYKAGFIRAALSTRFSTKRNLRISIYDRLGRARLEQHAWGGTKVPKGSNLAIPIALFQRGSGGIPAAQRPKGIIAHTPPRALRVLPRGIFIGSGGRLNLMYSFRASAQQPADVPFERDFIDAFSRDVNASFPAAMLSAMQTRR